MKDSGNVKLSILMPVRNEGVNLKIVLKILEAIVETPHEVLLIYDTLDDDSIPVIKQLQKRFPNIRGVHNKLGRGVPNAIKAGLNSSLGKYSVILSADDIGPIIAVDDMAALMDSGCDIVGGTRYGYGGRVMGGSPIGSRLSKTANKLLYILSGNGFTDLTFGIKMFKPSVFDKLNLEARPIGWSIALEMAIKAELSSFKIGEVPIVSINRFYGGESSFKLGPWVKEYMRWFLWGSGRILSKRNKFKVKTRIPLKIISKRKKNGK